MMMKKKFTYSTYTTKIGELEFSQKRNSTTRKWMTMASQRSISTSLTWREGGAPSLSHSTPRVHVQLLNKNFLALALPTDYTLEWTV